jgi:SPP1 gp7 family putative phage head morphogenesis protein
MKKLDSRLQQMLPEKIADRLQATELFDKTIYRVNGDVEETVRGLTVLPQLTEDARKKIAEAYNDNMKLYIKEWAEKEIKELRAKVQSRVYAGGRHESMVKMIQKSYGVGQNKAKFLARQETSILMAKFKEARYTDLGIQEYEWNTVVGSAKHPVRPMHKALKGKIFRWDNPPIVNEKGERKNPGEDYGCRCFARPIVKF